MLMVKPRLLCAFGASAWLEKNDFIFFRFCVVCCPVLSVGDDIEAPLFHMTGFVLLITFFFLFKFALVFVVFAAMVYL